MRVSIEVLKVLEVRVLGFEIEDCVLKGLSVWRLEEEFELSRKKGRRGIVLKERLGKDRDCLRKRILEEFQEFEIILSLG